MKGSLPTAREIHQF